MKNLSITKSLLVVIILINAISCSSKNFEQMMQPFKNSTDNDAVAPSVTVNQAASQQDPTASFPIVFEVVFSEPIDSSTFTIEDINQTGTATGLNWAAIETADNMNFTIKVNAVSGSVGTITPTIAAGAVTDAAGNENTASTSTDNSVYYDTVLPLALQSATATDNSHVKLIFNQNVDSITGAVAGNYAIAGLTVSSAVVSGAQVTLTTTSQTSNTADGYTVVVSNVKENSGTLVISAPYNSARFTGDTLPQVVSATSVDATNISITFSEAVLWDATAAGALNPSNYCIELSSDVTPQNCDNPVLTIQSVSSQTNGTRVRLTTNESQVSGTGYRLLVKNVIDTTTPTGNQIDAGANTATFTGLENMKISDAVSITPVTATAFRILAITFSKELKTGGGSNAVDKLSLWQAPPGTRILGLCTTSDDAACTATGFKNSNTTVLFKVDNGAGAPSVAGNYTFVAAGYNQVSSSFTFGSECILPVGGSSTTDCLQANPNDRVVVTFGDIPTNPGDGPVYDDPFNDGTTVSSQVLVYNNKLMIGPDNNNAGLFQTDINMTNATTITLDADNVTTGEQPFQDIYESCSGGTWPNCTAGNILKGIDYMYPACYHATTYVNSTLTGNACTTAGGTEYLFIVGFIASAPNQGYQSNWYTTGTTSPFVFTHIDGLSNAQIRTFRAMSVRVFKGWVFQAHQHQAGGAAPRWSKFKPGGAMVAELFGRNLNRIGESGTIKNGQGDVGTGLISIDVMYEYDNDGAGGNESQLYIANGGSCENDCLTNATPYRNGTTEADGGILRSALTYSTMSQTPIKCDNQAQCNTYWEDVTPTSATWLKYMSKALPEDAAGDGNCATKTVGDTEDWDCLVPANTVVPALKAIPQMATFNGDLYVIRNACSTNTVETITATQKKTCTNGTETPQLWRLPAGSTASPKGAGDWEFIGDVSNGKTTMKTADYSGGSDQATKTASNTEVTLLVANGNRLYIGFDNKDYGVNVWRTKAGVASPVSESDFEAVCQSGNACADPAKQFAGTQTIIFDAITVNDAGTDYLIYTAGNGIDPVKIFRTNNN